MKTTRRITLVALALLMVFSLVACAHKVAQLGVWESATHTSDKTFGKGAKTIKVQVIAEEQSVTFTIHTDKETLADALLEHKLIAGDDGPYGLYVKKVNGIMADYNVDGYYWSSTKDGELCPTGMSSTTIANGEHYELTRAK